MRNLRLLLLNNSEPTYTTENKITAHSEFQKHSLSSPASDGSLGRLKNSLGWVCSSCREHGARGGKRQATVQDGTRCESRQPPPTPAGTSGALSVMAGATATAAAVAGTERQRFARRRQRASVCWCRGRTREPRPEEGARPVRASALVCTQQLRRGAAPGPACCGSPSQEWMSFEKFHSESFFPP